MVGKTSVASPRYLAKYLLDTNTVSYLLRQNPDVTARVIRTPLANMAISAVTEAELRFGIAKRPEATRLNLAVNEMIMRFEVLPWDSAVAQVYGTLKANNQAVGKSLSDLDMQIAAHAVAVNRILVSGDAAFKQLAGLKVNDWAASRTT